MHYFVCCPNTVRTVFRHVIHSFPCVQTVFKQPAMQWCAVRTLFEVFEHHALLCVLSKHFRTCHTFVSMCSNGVRTVWSCLAMFEHFEQCSNCVLMPTTCGKSIPFLFYFPLSCLFVYSHPRPPASARTPIRNMSTRPDQ